MTQYEFFYFLFRNKWLILAGATVIFLYWIKQHRLIQMQRTFVSNVTHELKSPVASIQLALETMALRELSVEKRHEYVAMMLDDTERLSTLIDRILGAARIEKRNDIGLTRPATRCGRRRKGPS